MNLRNFASIMLVSAAAVLPACSSHQGHSLYTEVNVHRYNGDEPRAVVEKAKKQIIDRGRELGLTVTESAPDRLTLTALKAPASTGSSKMADERIAVATADFSTTQTNIRYRYWIDLKGSPPNPTTTAHEQAVLAGLFALREVFDGPLHVNTTGMAK